jgi:hypothetical protein
MSFIYPTPINGDLTNRTKFLIAQVTLSANGTIAERVPVLLSNADGSMGTAIAEQISAVAIVFDGAFYQGKQENLIGTASAGVLLIQAPYNVSLPGLGIMFGGPDLAGTRAVIYWPVQGDYHASLVLLGSNGSIWKQDYPENRVYVEPASTLEQEQYARNLNAIEIGTFFVGMYEAFVRISEWEAEREKKASD